MDLSVVVPVFNEEKMFPTLVDRLSVVLSETGRSYEIIFIDDGSSDATLDLIKDHRKKDSRIKLISFSRNFGHQPAVFAGLCNASGEAIGVIDGDLQDPPEVLPALYSKIIAGWDVVYAVRKNRKERAFKRFSYWLYYRLLRAISDTHIPLDSGDFCMMRRCVVEQLTAMKEQALFIRGLRAWVGFRQTQLEYERQSRYAGETKYTLKKLFDLAYRGVFNYSRLPIKGFTYLGMTTIVSSILYFIYTLIKKYFLGDVPEGFTTTIIFIMIFGGIQLLGLGVLGEYITRIYDETKDRPLFIIKESQLDNDN